MKEKIFTYLLATAFLTLLLMVLTVFGIVATGGLPSLWPKKLVEVTLKDGQTYLGEVWGKEKGVHAGDLRTQLKIGNRELYGQDFMWIDDADIVKMQEPQTALMLERSEWGNAYGFLETEHFFSLQNQLQALASTQKEIKKIERKLIPKMRKQLKTLQAKIGTESLQEKLKLSLAKQNKKLEKLQKKVKQSDITLLTADGKNYTIPFKKIMRVYAPNSMHLFEKTGLFFSRIAAFITTYPRESNTEGGIFPALFGTVFLVLLMSIFVFPLGVIVAIYLYEYAKPGPFLNLVQITIFNLAGVPSIVYGVFGLGFFVYALGGTIDHLFFSESLPSPTFGTGGILWAAMTMSLLTLPVVIVASLEGLNSIPKSYKEGAYALSATRWEVIKEVVIPSALPGMLTGLILAISRAAGEVAPLMMTGVVKLALTSPIETSFPFLHLDRKFMHLGFHIYDVGFQSPNVEACRPIVFNTTFLLLALVFILNLVAILTRNHLKKKMTRSGV